jgi:hypothetical protein
MPAMTVTVVTTRADNGVPATRDVYAGGVRYTTTNGNLQVISATRAPLAFYGSGNWLSVYVGQCVTVISGESIVIAGDSTADLVRTDPGGATADAGAGADEPTAWADELPATDTGDQLAVADRDDDLHPVQTPHPEVLGEPATTRADTGLRPPMRPVVIRTRTYTSPPRDPAPPARRDPRMRPVFIRAKTYISPPENVEPGPPPNPRMRQVTIRPRRQGRPAAVSDLDGSPERPTEKTD